ncbi:similar to Kazachstania africana KAFR_0G01940 hypothetical protein [Maudiozyma saulgeensis]|uniref:Uncharacterized protein n=1 Tax=Maudiozyma saulgeensis TaxID=1789683 RepID=A0A1X7R3Y8_9SACH|nr:similar to Kazachstania africana KAFR_0G01940 hypothetical protein [Kazachstania saulgeensis]
MLLKTTLFTLFTIYCAVVLASKYSITITSEDTTYKRAYQNSQSTTPKEANNHISIQVGNGTNSTELLQEIFEANSLQFTDAPDSPTFFKAKETKIGFDIVKAMLPDSLAKMDDPSDIMEIIMRDGRFANVRHIIKEIIEDFDEDEIYYDEDEDEDEEDEEDDGTNDFYFDDEEEEDDDDNYEDDDYYFMKRNKIMRKDNNFFTRNVPTSILLQTQTARSTIVSCTSFFENNNSRLLNLSSVETKETFSVTSHAITTHFPSRLFAMTSKNNPKIFNNNNTIPEMENNNEANKRFSFFLKPYHLVAFLFLLMLLIFDQ